MYTRQAGDFEMTANPCRSLRSSKWAAEREHCHQKTWHSPGLSVTKDYATGAEGLLPKVGGDGGAYDV